MDIWIIRDGESAGPFPDYEIRSRINSRELEAETLAWYEDQPQWLPLSEIPLFRDEFERQRQPADPPRPAHPAPAAPASFPPPHAATPPPLHKPAYIRRFWARWFDLHLYSACWWLLMWGLGRDISAMLLNPWISLTQFVPWFVLEAILLHRFGTTPGKWLLGIRVVNADRSLLSLASSTRRSLRVLMSGIGFGWGPLALFCQALSLFTARRLGNPLWDHLGGHRALTAPLVPWKVTLLALLFFVALQLQVAVIQPHLTEVFPQLKSLLERGSKPAAPAVPAE